MSLGSQIRLERQRRRWTLRELAARAEISTAVLHGLEFGRAARLDTYVRVATALALHLEPGLTDPRKRLRAAEGESDVVHAAMGEFKVARLSRHGFDVGIDEPYQHYQFAGRGDVVACKRDTRAFLHIENRTRFPDIQQMAGAYNAKRSYLADAVARRLGLKSGWAHETHVMAVLWSAEALHVLRLRTATFRALCPDADDDFVRWWTGQPPIHRKSSTLVSLDPLAAGRRRVSCTLDEALRARPRFRGYADAAQLIRARQLA